LKLWQNQLQTSCQLSVPHLAQLMTLRARGCGVFELQIAAKTQAIASTSAAQMLYF
jgi:hypothetical protein